MKLHLADTKNHYAVTGYGAGYLTVNGMRYGQPLIVTPDHAPDIWAVTDFDLLDAAALGALLRSRPDLIVLGTGPVQRFATAVMLRPLIEAGVGLEMMGTPAACRTYNILMGEGRRVVAAMFLP